MIKLFYTKEKFDYELLDTGEGEKLERFGKYVFIRPYENAVWAKSDKKAWAKADGKFWSSKTGAKSGWKMSRTVLGMKAKWEMEYKGIKFLAMPTPFRHMGFFPEQASHWDFIEQKIKASLGTFTQSFGSSAEASAAPSQKHTKSAPRFLNLFGYTGVASLFALRAGAEVTHLDASRQTLNWVKENEKLNLDIECPSGHPMSSIRIIEDDALKFLEREIKRGNKYDAVIMDPPKFGRGPKGEVWKLDEMLPKLLSAVRKVLSDKPLFVILTSYAIDSSSLSLGYALREVMQGLGGKVEQGELCVLEKSKGRFISLANTAIWSALEK